jgi:hypothetical protein
MKNDCKIVSKGGICQLTAFNISKIEFVGREVRIESVENGVVTQRTIPVRELNLLLFNYENQEVCR